MLLRHSVGTLCGSHRIFCMLMSVETSFKVIWLTVILRRGTNSKRESEQRESSKLPNLHLQKIKTKVHKKLLGQSVAISHRLKNLVNAGLLQI